SASENVLPDGPPARRAGVRTPFLICRGGTSRIGPAVGRDHLSPDQREGLRTPSHPDRYTRHEVAAPRVVGPSGRTSSSKAPSHTPHTPDQTPHPNCTPAHTPERSTASSLTAPDPALTPQLPPQSDHHQLQTQSLH